MISEKANEITIEIIVCASMEETWSAWNNAEEICQWNHASEDWHTTKAENDLQIGGKFNYRMEAKDGSFGFDFWGIYTGIKIYEQLNYTMGDGRKAQILFSKVEEGTKIIEIFEAENENPIELQRTGWLSILQSFKAYIESKTAH